MSNAATYAIIPDFLCFDVGEISLEMGGAQGDYARLERCVAAPLKAVADQLITSSAGHLGALNGKLVILDADDAVSDRSGSIRRSLSPTRETARAGYVVLIDLPSPAFDRFLTLTKAGRMLSGLSLDFQNIDGPLNEDPLDRPIPWDGVQYPHVALTNFLL